MIKANVLKPFHTATSRFKPGDAVTAADLKGHTFDLEHAHARGIVDKPVSVSPDAPAAEPAPAPQKPGRAK